MPEALKACGLLQNDLRAVLSQAIPLVDGVQSREEIDMLINLAPDWFQNTLVVGNTMSSQSERETAAKELSENLMKFIKAVRAAKTNKQGA